MPDRGSFQWALVVLAAAVAVSLTERESGHSLSASDPSRGPVWMEPAGEPAIASQPVVFRWAAVPGAERYRLRVGTAPEQTDLVHLAGLTTTSYVADELPSDRLLYARLSAFRDGRWEHAFLRFTAERVAAEWIHPPPGSPAAEPARSFEWTPVPDASAYRLVVGTSPGAADILDQRVGRMTRIDVPTLPVGRRLFARIQTLTRGSWYSRDSDFALVGYRAARPTGLGPGDTADLSQPITWQDVPLATGYRLRIGSSPGGAELHDSGIVHVTRRFVRELPAGPRLFATLTTVYADRSLDHQFTLRARPGVPSEQTFLNAALAATATVRAMAGEDGAWPRTLLSEVVRQKGTRGPGCEEFALALLRALAEQDNRLPSRHFGTCLLGNRYDCHTLVELYRPSAGTWMVLDPTFAVAARRADGEWVTAADLKDAVRRENWSGIRFVSLDGESRSRLRSSYIDYPLYFVSPLREGRPETQNAPSILHYYERVPLPVRGEGHYAVRCLQGTSAEVLIDGRTTTVACHGSDRLSEIRPASSIEGQPGAVQVYRPRRFLF
jgi:hypothetical protein